MSDLWLRQQYTGPTGYDVMQVCINGHRITATARHRPEHCQDYCANCGAATITKCQECDTPIRGYHHGPGFVTTRGMPVPKYCIKCGVAYPWQAAALENLKGILREGGLSDADMQEATQTLPDVIQDTPKTEFASLKFKRILGKLGKPVYEIAVKVVTDIASETAKKTMGLS